MKSARFKCPICDFTCGRNKQFTEHLKDHGYSSQEDAYIDLFLDGEEPLCGCNICNVRPGFSSWNKGFAKFLKGHNGSIYTAYNKEEAEAISNKRKQKLIGSVGWSRGLSKETDERILSAAKTRSKTVTEQFRAGDRIAWSKGLTKETDERIAKNAKYLSDGFAAGRFTPWAKGLTKETDERIYQMSLTVSKTHREKGLRKKLDSLKRLSPDVILERLSDVTQLQLLSDLSSYSRDRHVNLDFLCTSCGKKQTKSLIQAINDRCSFCSPPGSKGQNEVWNFLKDLGVETLVNDRSVITPYEIDITVPSRKFGVEYNGLYFHSELFKNKHYHDMKSIEALRNGWSILHIFEDDWHNKQDIVKSMISYRCRKNITSIGARKCNIIELSRKERKDFFEMTHIDGDSKASKAWGLIDKDDKLVAAISVRRPMHKKFKGTLEIARYATSLNTSIPGGLSKLCKKVEQYAKENSYHSIISYVDSRIGIVSQIGYEQCGFNFVNFTIPRFWWTDGKERIDRFKIRADSETGQTEKEIAEQYGVVKIWGCRNLLYEKKI